jgi:hypothetical protein
VELIRVFEMAQNESESNPIDDPTVAHAAAETVRAAHAVGLVAERTSFAELTYPAIQRVVERVREAGIAADAAWQVQRRDTSREDLATALRRICEQLEESPLPDTEWRRLPDVLGRDLVARLLGIATSSAGRYERGERQTPDDVAARLHFLALVTGDLAGAYNDIGIRRWFDRKRTALDGKSPAQLLAREWQPEDAGPRRVRALARALVASPGT